MQEDTAAQTFMTWANIVGHTRGMLAAAGAEGRRASKPPAGQVLATSQSELLLAEAIAMACLAGSLGQRVAAAGQLGAARAQAMTWPMDGTCVSLQDAVDAWRGKFSTPTSRKKLIKRLKNTATLMIGTSKAVKSTFVR